MSSNKRMCLRSDTFKRQSFDERICEDLCPSLLQFLSLEDKLKLKFVSKQFQRTIYCSQPLPLIIGETDLDNLETLLQNSPSITSISFIDSSEMSRRAVNQSIKLIVKYCNHLTDFECDSLHSVDPFTQMAFFEKFGEKLVSINGLCSPFVDGHTFWTLDQMPNIEEIYLFTNQTFYGFHYPNINLKRLKRLSFTLFFVDNHLNEFEDFIETNGESIRHLDIFGLIGDSNQFKAFLKIVSNLTNLVHLRIESINPLNENSLTQITVKCSQLKSLAFSYELSQNGPNADHLLALRKRLKRLSIEFVGESTQFMGSTEFSLKGLKQFTELTHILFFSGVNPTPNLSETVFTEMDIIFPKLQFLCLHGMKVNVSENTVGILSRMRALQSIWLESTQPKEKLSELNSELFEKCKKLR